ncbi:MAG: glycosyltransferase [Candidatus Bathyarchaeia archaeon]
MDFLIVSERVTDDPTEAMMIGRIRRYTSTFENSRPFLVIGGKAHDSQWRSIGPISRAHYGVVGRQGVPEFIAHLAYFASLIFVGAKLAKRKPSIQFVTHPYAHYTLGAIAVVLAKITGRKAIVRVGSSISELLTRSGIRYKIVYSILLGFERFAFEQADAIATGSPRPLEQQQYRTKCFYIPYFMEGKLEPNPHARRASNFVLFVGRLEPEKGISILMDAVKLLLERGREANFTIVGAGSLQGKLRDELESRGLQGHVKMTGYLTHSKVLRMMHRATLLVLPSLIDYNPNVVIEAAFSELPVVATYTGGIPYLIEHRRTGILVRPMDPHALANAIEELLLDSVLRKKIAFEARKSIARRFSPKRAKQATRKLTNYVFAPKTPSADLDS